VLEHLLRKHEALSSSSNTAKKKKKKKKEKKYFRLSPNERNSINIHLPNKEACIALLAFKTSDLSMCGQIT
jgi:hypothetical protein